MSWAAVLALKTDKNSLIYKCKRVDYIFVKEIKPKCPISHLEQKNQNSEFSVGDLGQKGNPAFTSFNKVFECAYRDCQKAKEKKSFRKLSLRIVLVIFSSYKI